MAHAWSWPSHLSFDHLVRDPRSDRDRHLRGHFSPPVSWSTSDWHFHPSSAQSPPYHIDKTLPVENPTRLMPAHSTLAISRNDRNDFTPRGMPKMSFKAVIETLETTNGKAQTFFSKFHNSFNEDVGPKLPMYATRDSLNGNWIAKVRHHETKCRTRHEQNRHQDDDVRTDYDRDQSFLEMRNELLRRCTNTQILKVPKWPLTTVEDLERKNSADALVAKLTASIRELMPNLQRCDQSVFAMKAALREMDTIANNLETHRDARECEGARRQEHDQDDNENEHGDGEN